MANKFFNIKHGIKVGNFEVDANDGSVTTSGNITLTGNAVLSTTAGANITVGNVIADAISKGDSSLSIVDTGSNSSISIIIDGTTEHTVDADGVNLASGDRFAINGTSVLNATTLGSGVTASSLTSVGTLGSLTVSGNASAGNISTGGVLSVTGNANVGNIGATSGVFTNVSGNGSALTALTAGNLTGTIPSGVQGNITQTGTLTALTVTGTATAGNLSTGGTLNVTGNANVGNLGTAGLITATGNVTGGNLVTAGTVKAPSHSNGTSNVAIVQDSNVTVSVGGAANVMVVTTTGANVAGTGNFTGTVTAGNVTTGGTLNATGNANVGNLGTAGLITATGNVTGGNIIATNGVYGDGSGLSNLVAGNLAGTIPSGVLGNSTVYIGSTGVALNRSTAALSLTGVSIDGSAATVTGAAQGNITSVGTLTSLSVTGNASAGNISTGGVLSVTGNANVGNIGATNGVFTNVSGNASAMTNIPGANITGTIPSGVVPTLNQNTTGYAATVSGAAQGNITSVGTLTSLTVTGNVSGGNLSTGGVLSVTGNANVGNLGTAGLITATGNVSGGNLNTGGVVSATGNVSGGNLTTAGQIKTTGTAAATSTSTGAIVSGGGLGVAGNLHVGGTAHNIAGNLTLAGNLTVQGTTTTITSNNVSYVDSIIELNNSADSSPLTTDNGKDVGIRVHYYKGSDKHAFFGWANDSSSFEFYSDGTETGGTFSGTYGVMKGAQFNSTATTGTAPFIVNSTTTVANLAAATATTAGTVTSAAQGNITSVGTLTSLSVTGNANVGNIGAAAGVFTTVTGSAAGMTSIPAGNLSGTIPGGVLGNSTHYIGTTSIALNRTSASQTLTGVSIDGSAGSATTAGTVTTAAQGNITSVGTLTALTVSGQTTISGNIASTTTGTGSMIVTGTQGGLGVAGNINAGAYYGAGTGLTAIPAGNLTGSVPSSTLTSVPGANITGTIPSGVVPTLNQNTTGYAATVSGAAQGNITSVGTLTGLGVNGTVTAVNITANTGVFTGNAAALTNIPGANITGTIPSGVVPTLNQNTTGYAATVSGAAQGNITSVGTLTSLSVTGNITSVSGNVTGTHYGSAAGLTGIPGANITGTIPSGVVPTLNQNTTGYAATVSGASQGNITSVGTLTSLTTSGTIQPNANATIDLGATAARFNNVYGVTFIGIANTAKYADLAEKYTADAEYEPGTVLHFGGAKEVTHCDTDMCSKVAGVVTTAPAYLMNSHLEAEHTAAIALQGRVPCKVVGPVAKGDMMVSAGNGRARAEANPKIGSVIGKALEAHADGEGVIEVVVGRV